LEFGKSFMPDVPNWGDDAPNLFEDDDEAPAKEDQE
jgi:hypothetical protein